MRVAVLAAGRWPLAAGRWPLAAGRWPLAAGRWPLASLWAREPMSSSDPHSRSDPVPPAADRRGFRPWCRPKGLQAKMLSRLVSGSDSGFALAPSLQTLRSRPWAESVGQAKMPVPFHHSRLSVSLLCVKWKNVARFSCFFEKIHAESPRLPGAEPRTKAPPRLSRVHCPCRSRRTSSHLHVSRQAGDRFSAPGHIALAASL